jgi:hypothetical protein
MRILVLAPLFPPDVSAPALYAKELVTRLSCTHEVTCLHYGQLPEQAGQARLVSIRKDVATPIRLIVFLRTLWSQRHTDILVTLNGPSVELPTILLRPLLPRPRIYIEHDGNAIMRTHWFGRLLRHRMKKIASHTVVPAPILLERPVLHPFDTTSHQARSDYDAAWVTHIGAIMSLCQK